MSDIIIEILPPAEINVNLGKQVPWEDVTDKPTAFPPSVHGSTHLPAGTDPIPGIVTEAPTDGNQYGRQNSGWTAIRTQATITGNYTILSTDENIFVNTASAITISIPDALPLGKTFNIFRLITGGNITVDTVGAETINGAATYTFYGSSVSTQISFKKSTGADYISGESWEVPPVVRAEYKNQNVTTVSGAFIYITKIEDTHNAYNTANGEYTVPIAGVYAINGTMVTPTATPSDIQLHKNGTLLKPMAASNQANLRVGYATNVRLAVNDKITVKNSSVGQTANADDTISIVRIGS